MRDNLRRSLALMLAATLFMASASILFAAKFKSTWNAPGAGPLNFLGKKVVALVIPTIRTWRSRPKKRSRVS